MKTALLLSGHMRSYKLAYENQLETIIEPNNCDVFITTSTINTFIYSPDMKFPEEKPDAYYHLPHEDGSSGIIEAFQSEKESLSREIRDVYGPSLKGLLIEDEDMSSIINNNFENDRKWAGHEKAWLRVKKCNDLKGKYEEENNIKYDTVIKSRTDLIFRNPLKIYDFDMTEEDVFLNQHQAHPKISFQDQFAFGNFKAMDVYCNMYDYYGKFREESAHGGFRSEDQLADYLLMKELKINKINSFLQFGMIRGGSFPEDDKKVQV
jgi:hypothetical protein